MFKIEGRLTLLLVLVAALAAAPAALRASRAPSDAAMAETSIRSHLETGDLLVGEREFVSARQAYNIAANWVRAGGRLPVEEMRRIANAYYFEGRYLSAKEILDELADEAGAHGDLTTQVWAIADAAHMAALAGVASDVEFRLERLESLLESSAMTDEARYQIKAKLTQDLSAFAPHLAAW